MKAAPAASCAAAMQHQQQLLPCRTPLDAQHRFGTSPLDSKDSTDQLDQRAWHSPAM